MPRAIDGEPKQTAVSRPQPSCSGSDRRFWDVAPKFRRPRHKPLAGSSDSAVARMETRQGVVDTGSSERWFYFATAVLFVAIIATFGTLIWQVARAFK